LKIEVNVLDYNTEIGRVVYSKAGRDSERYFVIISVLDDEYIYICDGELRKIENPKKKKLKHLKFTDIVSEDVKNSLLSGMKVSNSQVKKFLQSEDFNKEV
jgi:ribosomal protein L14E/L6E/L27E